MSDNQKYLEFAVEQVKAAGEVMKYYFDGNDASVTWKADQTVLTAADTKINSDVIKAIKEVFPGHGVYGEEESFEGEGEFVWVLDPIDGTVPFVAGIPISTFNLALTKNGKTEACVQYNPWQDKLYSATKGGGTFLNGEKLTMSDSFVGRKTVNLEIYGGPGSTIFQDLSAERESRQALPADEYILMKLISVGFSIGLTAGGKIAAAVFSGSKPFEAATGNLIITEAGGQFSDLFGKPIERFDKDQKGFIAAPPKLHAELVQLLAPAIKEAPQKAAN